MTDLLERFVVFEPGADNARLFEYTKFRGWGMRMVVAVSGWAVIVYWAVWVTERVS